MKSTLHLNLERKYFAEIAAGTKRIEYRERKPYWRKRLEGRKYDVIKFRNGYATEAPEMLVEFRGLRNRGKTYEILLGRVLKIKRWKP
jgi:ASC-1-like (ASCH) protein